LLAAGLLATGLVATTGRVATTRGVTTTGRVATTCGVTATGRVTTTRGVTATGRVAATRSIATADIGTTGRVTTADIGTARGVTATADIGATGRVTALGAAFQSQTCVELGVGGQAGHIHIDHSGGRRRTGSGERGTCGDHRTGGDPRDAYARLLGHLLLPPVAVLVSGAAICGPRLRGVRSERRHIES
ncbi:hypothetical protein, partial [Streptomyces sp. NPDC047985]|uniref:hypothetical protein n=1 Tax=Streptomyces sp. NPDC047985 TaxID=3155384 RepID=UPI0034259A43